MSTASPSLLELQRGFCRAVFDEDAVSLSLLSPWIVDQGELNLPERIAIYRNNTVTNLRQALRADYPVVERLVGADFFAFAANAFVAATPSTSGDINDYGVGFSEFLASFPAASGLPYLPDVARLERASAEVFVAADALPGDFSRLAALAPEHFLTLSFVLHPAIRLLASAYPIQRIWQVNQADFSGDDRVDLRSGGDALLVRRQHDVVEIVSLTPGEYAWLDALRSGSCLAVATEAAFVAEPAFDLNTCLQRHIAESTLIDYLLEYQS